MTADNISPMRKTVPCPECGQPSDRHCHPFCSERCKNMDLGRWLNGSYAIPVSEIEENLDQDDDDRG
jgi:endogenous inhibitor of DNA gyrase (YacG/DUF329 family)